MQKKKSARHLNKVAELAAALLLSASPLAGTFQPAAFVQAASQEKVSPRSASRAALTSTCSKSSAITLRRVTASSKRLLKSKDRLLAKLSARRMSPRSG